MQEPLLSIVIPVFNSQHSLPELLELLQQICKREEINYEVICVDDGSKDKSWHVLKQQHLLYDNLSVITFARNFGQQAATLCGILHAKGNLIATIDDDLEYHPENILTLLFSMRQTNLKMVYGFAPKPERSKWMSWIADTAKKFAYQVCGLSPDLSSFRLFRREVIEGVDDMNSNYFLVDSLMKKNIGELWTAIRIVPNKRKYGQSQYTFGKLVATWTRFILSGSSFGEYSAVALLLLNIVLILNQMFWLALILSVVALFALYLTFRIKWIERKSYKIKESLLSVKQ